MIIYRRHFYNTAIGPITHPKEWRHFRYFDVYQFVNTKLPIISFTFIYTTGYILSSVLTAYFSRGLSTCARLQCNLIIKDCDRGGTGRLVITLTPTSVQTSSPHSGRPSICGLTVLITIYHSLESFIVYFFCKFEWYCNGSIGVYVISYKTLRLIVVTGLPTYGGWKEHHCSL